MNVLSLFNGMSCGEIALRQVGIIPEIYYSSEIDKHAIAQTQLNFPNTIQLGSVVDINVNDLQPIDLLIGGSPCQSFSFAGKRKGMVTKCEIQITKLEQYLELKESGFEFEGQSYLFWEYMRILTDIRKYSPDVKFLLENVEMGSKWERILSEAIGIYGVHINSALVSAQNRKRIYWTNIQTKEVGLFGELHANIPQPEDKGILLKDILESEVDEKYYLSDKSINSFTKHLERNKENGNGFGWNLKTGEEKSAMIPTGSMKSTSTYITTINYVQWDVSGKGYKSQQDRAHYDAGKMCCIPSARTENKINVVVHNLMPRSSTTGKGGTGSLSRNDGKTYCLDTGQTNAIEIQTSRIRRLTPTECARLQTIPSWYKWECSDTQIYRMCGNGWTVDVIAHIFLFLKTKTDL
jgi:DNA (cytosine-5)-methyltransferase 3A